MFISAADLGILTWESVTFQPRVELQFLALPCEAHLSLRGASTTKKTQYEAQSAAFKLMKKRFKVIQKPFSESYIILYYIMGS